MFAFLKQTGKRLYLKRYLNNYKKKLCENKYKQYVCIMEFMSSIAKQLNNHLNFIL